MNKVYGNIWHIVSEDSFFANCEYAKESIAFAASHGEKTQNRWFFAECYANWKENNHSVIFKSYNVPEYKNYILSISVKLQPNKKYTFTINKEITGSQTIPTDHLPSA